VYETWSLRLSEEHRLRYVFESRMLRSIFEHKNEEVTGWREVRIAYLNNLHSSLNIVK
jgi:hypothetical protein